MIQDIFPHVYHNAFQKCEAQPQDMLLAYRGNAVLSAPEEFRLPRCGDLPDMPVRYAFSIDDTRYFLAENAPEEQTAWRLLPSAEYRYALPRETAFACAVGETLHRWYCSNRFCGACGAEMADSAAERALCCPKCGAVVYPRINPAVIVAVTDGEKLLLTKYAGRAFRRFALVAGFCEIGERVEDTVRREVWEETGLRVKNLRFYKSQPWVLTDSLLLGFFCDLDGEATPRLLDGELALAQWFDRADLPEDHSDISLTGEMIEFFRKNGLTNAESLL